MNSRERVLAAINHKEPARVPIDLLFEGAEPLQTSPDKRLFAFDYLARERTRFTRVRTGTPVAPLTR